MEEKSQLPQNSLTILAAQISIHLFLPTFVQISTFPKSNSLKVLFRHILQLNGLHPGRCTELSICAQGLLAGCKPMNLKKSYLLQNEQHTTVQSEKVVKIKTPIWKKGLMGNTQYPWSRFSGSRNGEDPLL